MWYLQSINGVCFYLIGKNEFTVGRKLTDFILDNDDSISRTHARITIDIEITSGKMLPVVHITDSGSKYGTFIDSEQLKPQQTKSLKENSTVTFGLLESCFTLHQLKLTVISSNIKPSDRPKLQQCLEFLKATSVNEWSNNCSHLVVSNFILTIKALRALTHEKPIVSIAFFTDLVVCVKENRPIPDCKDYLPELNESLLSRNIKIEYNRERQCLFNDKILVFMTEKRHKAMEALIKATGGNSVSWKSGKLSQNELASKSPEYLLIESNLDDQSSISASESFFDAIEIIKSLNKRTIPFQEIALAIIHCSITEYCNASINKTMLLVSETQTQRSDQILAYDTQHVTEHSTVAPVVIPESYDRETITPVIFTKPKLPLSLSTRNVDASVSRGGLDVEVRGKRGLEPETDLSAKRFCDDASTSSAATSEFPFNRASNSSSGTKQSMFSCKETDYARNADIVNNPFAKKRKATSKIMEPPAKKSPLTNISNQLTDCKPDITTITDGFLCSTQITPQKSLTTTFSNISLISKESAWYSNLNVKKELDEELKSEFEEDTEQELIRRRNESFKNSIIIETLPAIMRRSHLSRDSGNVASSKNYKKFKKVQHSFIQTRILENMIDLVVGNVDQTDEEEVEEEVGFDRVEPRKQARKFGRIDIRYRFTAVHYGT